MRTKRNQLGFGDFTSFIFIGIFTVIGGLFIVRIFAASRPTITLQLNGYSHISHTTGRVDYHGVQGRILLDNSTACTLTGTDPRWPGFKVKNGSNLYDSHPLISGSMYVYNISCSNSAGKTETTQTVSVP